MVNPGPSGAAAVAVPTTVPVPGEGAVADYDLPMQSLADHGISLEPLGRMDFESDDTSESGGESDDESDDAMEEVDNYELPSIFRLHYSFYHSICTFFHRYYFYHSN